MIEVRAGTVRICFTSALPLTLEQLLIDRIQVGVGSFHCVLLGFVLLFGAEPLNLPLCLEHIECSVSHANFLLEAAARAVNLLVVVPPVAEAVVTCLALMIFIACWLLPEPLDVCA